MTSASVTITARPPDWRQDTACAGFDTRLFYGGIADQRRAQRVCCGCPVAEPCLWAAMLEEHGLAARHRFGVRGGLLPCACSPLAAVLGRGELVGRYDQAADRLQRPQGQPGAAA